MKTLLFIISCITLLSLTSCEKDDMDRTGTGGGGKEDANTITKSATNTTPKDNEKTFLADTTLRVDG
ncbi:hypothetical protein G7051_07865 [Dysgonomonas sp. HDW5B]|uniref:hypothetical protein n=1 Tax=Dysgonomonas sp. HDW5B TaxID=2714927 RepID=UPI00140CC6C7|nr:hypothetical protein [Dysgonomonas sp. HDW5B]QIK54258.1 hypothetical protein G7051_07865 [Dysgonomonas sp. HDW5B]